MYVCMYALHSVLPFRNGYPKIHYKVKLFWHVVSGSTYIHNWSLEPFSQDYDLASHITYVVCVNFIHEWRELQFKVDSERQIFEKFFIAILFTQSFCQKSAEKKSLKQRFHIFVLMFGLGLEPWLFV